MAPGIWGRSHWCRLIGLICLLGWCAGWGGWVSPVEHPPTVLGRCAHLLSLSVSVSETFSMASAPSAPLLSSPFSEQLSVVGPNFTPPPPVTFHLLSHLPLTGSLWAPGPCCHPSGQVPHCEPCPMVPWSACDVPPLPTTPTPKPGHTPTLFRISCDHGERSPSVIQSMFTQREQNRRKPGLTRSSLQSQAIDKTNQSHT